jgi:hypothetical protein
LDKKNFRLERLSSKLIEMRKFPLSLAMHCSHFQATRAASSYSRTKLRSHNPL